MAFEPHAGGVNRPTNGERPQNGDAPSSTLAAQLVQRFTNGTKRSKNQDSEAFRQLLSEVLGTASDQSFSSETLENDVNINTKLIYVIVKAGLESLPSHSLFDSGSETYSQLVDSLVALEITLSRCPEVLFVKSPNQETQPYGSGSLYQWLLLKLFAFLTNPDILDGDEGVDRLLKLCILKDEKLQFTPFKRRPILTYIKGCIRG